MEGILGYFIIFFARVADVSLGTLRTMLIVRGNRVPAALLGFVEVLIFIMILKMVVSELDNFGRIFAYAAGFATGTLVGGWVEEKMALGDLNVQIIAKGEGCFIPDQLREAGFAVTVTEGKGLKGRKCIMNVILKRRNLPRLMKLVQELDVAAFVSVMDARSTSGGLMSIRKSK